MSARTLCGGSPSLMLRSWLHSIPYIRNYEVIKHQAEVEKLHQLLSNPSACQAAALWGLGGSGKTQLALQYAYQRWDARDCSVFWVHADMEATFIQDYKLIAQKLGLDDTKNEENLLEAVRDKIESLESWVLVIDNTDDIRIFFPGQSSKETAANLIRYIPQSAGKSGTVPWTSRDERIDAIVGPGRAIEISRMTEGEGRKLLYTKWNAKNSGAKDDTITKLLEELEWLALAISQAGAFMRRTQILASEYLSMLSRKKHRWELFKASETADIQQTPGVPNSVLGTWHISIERVQKENQLAYHILNVLAYVNNQNISEKMVAEFAKFHGERAPIDWKDFKDDDKEHIVADDNYSDEQSIEILTALARLKEYSFIQIHRDDKKQKSYSMHKLVQDAARFGLSAGLIVNELKSGTSSGGERYYAAIALKVMARLFPGNKPGMWQQSEKYVEHAVQAAEWAEISGTPVRAAVLLDRVCAFLADRGYSLEARSLELTEKNLSICQQALGGRHPDTLYIKYRLAYAYFHNGAKQAAKDMTNQVYPLQREVLGNTNLDTLRTLSLKVTILCDEGEFEESHQLLTQAMRCCRDDGKEKSYAAAIILDRRAWLSMKQGDHEKAAKLASSSLKIYQKKATKPIQTIRCMQLLAKLYVDIGRYSEAVPVGESALDLAKARWGSKHLTTNFLMHRLARSYFELEQYAKAEPLAKEAVRVGQDLPGRSHHATLMRESKRLLAEMSKLGY
ncbi:unnamed protein product [Clonostachys rosea f. rosea IK726]|uniref:Uncharacterized protein n=1 Tax=Clonostachys rosea f. rosea IK726 TaxID=1349383 RepID=A0ACA9U0Y5_BIOOC|nr:unnamed protein product [Clonostachys rosea f. rosea IK726]